MYKCVWKVRKPHGIEVQLSELHVQAVTLDSESTGSSSADGHAGGARAGTEVNLKAETGGGNRRGTSRITGLRTSLFGNADFRNLNPLYRCVRVQSSMHRDGCPSM